MGRIRMRSDVEKRENQTEYNKLYYKRHRDKIREARRHRYMTDSEYRKNVIAAALRSRARQRKSRAKA